MNSKVYKWCAVPLCKNTTIATPNKVFIYVPNKKKVRDRWLKLARRDPASVVTNSPLYFCEDHFDLPNDMENYMQYHVMGSVSQVRTKPGCVPKKFDCQSDSKTQIPNTRKRPNIIRKRKLMTLESEKKSEERNPQIEHVTVEEIPCIKTEDELSDFCRPIKREKLEEEVKLRNRLPNVESDNLHQKTVDLNSKERKDSASYNGSMCNFCEKDIIGFRYACVQCSVWDMCGDCEARGHHAAHYVIRVPAPDTAEKLKSILETIRCELLNNNVFIEKVVKVEQEDWVVSQTDHQQSNFQRHHDS